MRKLRCFPFSPNCIFTEKTVDTYVTIFYLPRRVDLFPRKFHSILPNYHFALPWMFLLSSVSISDFLREECDAVLFIIPCLDLPLPPSEMNLALSAKFTLPSRLFPIIVATTERKVTDNIIYQFINKAVSLVSI